MNSRRRLFDRVLELVDWHIAGTRPGARAAEAAGLLAARARLEATLADEELAGHGLVRVCAPSACEVLCSTPS